MSTQILLSGTSNKPLAQEIAQQLHLKLGKIEIKRFSDAESFVRITEDVAGAHVFIIQSGSQPANEHLIEILQIIDAAQRSGAEKITTVLPFLPYRRQERAINTGECISAELVAKLLEASGATSVIAGNLHTPHIETFYSISITNIELWDAFIPVLQKQIHNTENYCVVAPDAGSVEDSSIISKALQIPLVLAEKHRPSHDTVQVKCVVGDVSGKNVIIVDDEINTAGTVCAVAKALTDQGARDIILAATHPVLSGDAIKNITNSNIKKIITSNTINLSSSQQSDKITQISVAQIFAEAIRNH